MAASPTASQASPTGTTSLDEPAAISRTAPKSRLPTRARVCGTASRADLSRRLRIVFERLGPTYIKLGQIVSSGRGMFPDELVDEFTRCRDQVPPEPFSDVRAVVEEGYRSQMTRWSS